MVNGLLLTQLFKNNKQLNKNNKQINYGNYKID